MAQLQKDAKPAAAPFVRPHTGRLAADGELDDGLLDQVSGGTTTGSNVMKSNSDTQSGLAANLKAS